MFNPKYQILYADKESATDSFGIYCKKLFKKAKIDIGEIAINSIPDVPIWDSEPVTVDFTLSEFDKSSTSSTVFKSRFNEVKQKYLDFCHIYTDGSKVETKVTSAYVCPYGTIGYRLRDGCSNFTAEVKAINKALTYVNVSSRKSFVIFSDSLSVLQAIESQESKNHLVNRVLQTCQKILSNGKFITFCSIPSHRYITGNEHADRAAKDALSKAQPTHFKLHCTNVFIKIQPFVSYLWQKRWDKEVGNKLHAIMPQIDDKYYSGCKNRKDKVIINRLRIGHTRLTDLFRMENRPHPPLCDQCEGDHELTVKHILIECNFLKIIRRRHYDVTDLNQYGLSISIDNSSGNATESYIYRISQQVITSNLTVHTGDHTNTISVLLCVETKNRWQLHCSNKLMNNMTTKEEMIGYGSKMAEIFLASLLLLLPHGLTKTITVVIWTC